MPGMIAAVGIWMCYDAANHRNQFQGSNDIGGLAWQAWNPGKIEYSLAKKKKIIWVDYTADW
jgi:thiol:disulfide interchange protein